MSSITRRRFAGGAAITLAAPYSGAASDLKKDTLRAFDEHVRVREQRMGEERLKAGSSRFLWLDDSPQRRDRAKSGEVAIAGVGEKTPLNVTGGLIHDWAAGVFIPSANLARVMGVVQDYDRHKHIYQPEILDSKLIKRDGDHFSIYYRLMKKKVLTAVLNTEHDIRYFSMGSGRVHSRSYSTRINEVESPGQSGEKELPTGGGHGFLWRLNSYWRFAERDGGVYVECEAISLSRGIPFGMGWVIEPIIRDLPQESLEKSLAATRDASKA